MMHASPWPLQSRVHRLNHFPSIDGECFVKRDDELACGISGTKLRKYASLIPHWHELAIERLIIIGGAQSNNVVAALQVARENGWDVTLLLLKPYQLPQSGNYVLSQLMLDEEDIHWVERDKWSQVGAQAEAIAQACHQPCFVLSEGASVEQAMSGAMTLGQDILRNQDELGLVFDHIYIDAGTGFAAIALIKALNQANHSGIIHVVSLADDIKTLQNKISRALPTAFNYRLHRAATAKAFGSVNASVKASIKRMAREEGVLVDAIYSAKLFLTARELITQQQLSGNKLIVHSGGTLSLVAAASSR